MDRRPNFISPIVYKPELDNRQWGKKNKRQSEIVQTSVQSAWSKKKERQKKAAEGKRIFKVRAKKEGHWGHRARNHVCLIPLRCGPSLESRSAY